MNLERITLDQQSHVYTEDQSYSSHRSTRLFHVCFYTRPLKNLLNFVFLKPRRKSNKLHYLTPQAKYVACSIQYSPLLSLHRFRFCWRTKAHISENEDAKKKERKRKNKRKHTHTQKKKKIEDAKERISIGALYKSL